MRLPVFDESDNQIGLKERDELLKTDIYRVSALWITDPKGRHLLSQRALTKKNSPGKWGPAVAGTVEEGETYDTNIVKEIQEEIGISLSLEELRKGFKTRRETSTSTYFTQWYFATIDKELDEFTFPEQEVMVLAWHTDNELRAALIERPDDILPAVHESIDALLSAAR